MNRFLDLIGYHRYGEYLFKGIFGIGISRLTNRFLVFLLGVVLARLLGPEQYSAYVFAISTISLLSIPVVAGLPILIVKEIARNHVLEKWGVIKGLLIVSNLYVLVASAIIIGISVLWMITRGQQVSPDVVLNLKWAVWLIPLLAFTSVRSATIRGFRRVVAAELPELLKPVGILLLISIAIQVGVTITTLVVLQMYLLTIAVCVLTGWVIQSRVTPISIFKSRPIYEFRSWVIAAPLFLFSALNMAQSQISVIVLGSLGPVDSPGLYRIADQGAVLVIFGLGVVNARLGPIISRLFHSGKMEELQKVVTIGARVMFLAAALVTVVFFLFGQPLISTVFGQQYLAAYPVLLILCMGQLVNAACGPAALVLNMTGLERTSVKALGVALAVNVVLNVFLVPFYGEIGAAIASSVSLALWNIMLIVAVRKKTGIGTSAFEVRSFDVKQ